MRTDLKSLKIKTNLLAITGGKCIRHPQEHFVGIKRLISYLQILQLNVNNFSTCTYKLQVSYIITQVTKLYPLPTRSPRFYSPSLLLWSKQAILRITSTTNGHRLPCDIMERMGGSSCLEDRPDNKVGCRGLFHVGLMYIVKSNSPPAS